MWLGLVSLTDLNLIANEMPKLQTGAFVAVVDGVPDVGGLPENKPLQKLQNINGPNVQEIKPCAFRGPTGCTWLSLSKLLNITPGAFLGLDSLQNLMLSYNKLTVLQPGAFQGIEGLSSISLVGNEITDIEARTFSNMTSLGMLELTENKLTEIKNDMWSPDLRKLVLLDLDDNEISTVQDGAFISLKKLKYLNLGSNQIREIHGNMWKKLCYLRSLNLEQNKIKNVPNGGFANLRFIKRISLNNNNLTTLTSDMLDPSDFPRSYEGHPKHLVLKLGGNPLQCDNRMCWIQMAKDDGWMSWEEDSVPQCANLPDTTWQDVDLSCADVSQK